MKLFLFESLSLNLSRFCWDKFPNLKKHQRVIKATWPSLNVIPKIIGASVVQKNSEKKHPSRESGIITPRRHQIHLPHLVWMFFGTSCFKESVPEPLERKGPKKKNRRPSLGIFLDYFMLHIEKGGCKIHIVTILSLTPATLVLTTSFWGGRKSSTERGSSPHFRKKDDGILQEMKC